MASWLDAELVIPPNDGLNRGFYEAQAGGKLFLPKCNDCGLLHYPQRTMCPDCRSKNLGFVEVSGEGTIHSYFILSQPIHPAFHPHPNTPIALIELDEQKGIGGGGDRTVQPVEHRALRLIGNIVKADGSFEDPDNVAINKRVQVKIIDMGDGMGLPQWQLSDQPADGPEWQVPGA